MASIVDYYPCNSIIHRLNPLTKMIWLIAVMVVALTFNNGIYLLLLLGSVVAVAAAAKVLPKLLPMFKGLLLFSLMMILLQVLFLKQGDILIYLLPGKKLPVYSEAVYLGMAMSIRMMAIVLSFLVFLATTQYKDIILTMHRQLKLPYDYVFMFMTALRFIPAFLTEIKLVREAQATRGCLVDGNNPVIKIKSYGAVAVPLVLISLQKAEQLAMAMETRGYGSGQRTQYQEMLITAKDWLFIMLTIILTIAAIAFKISGH